MGNETPALCKSDDTIPDQRMDDLAFDNDVAQDLIGELFDCIDRNFRSLNNRDQMSCGWTEKQKQMLANLHSNLREEAAESITRAVRDQQENDLISEGLEKSSPQHKDQAPEQQEEEDEDEEEDHHMTSLNCVLQQRTALASLCARLKKEKKQMEMNCAMLETRLYEAHVESAMALKKARDRNKKKKAKMELIEQDRSATQVNLELVKKEMEDKIQREIDEKKQMRERFKREKDELEQRLRLLQTGTKVAQESKKG